MTRSQSDRVLCYLCTGKTLTALQALQRFGTMRLAARIRELRDCGHRIASHRAQVGGKYVAVYQLVRP